MDTCCGYNKTKPFHADVPFSVLMRSRSLLRETLLHFDLRRRGEPAEGGEQKYAAASREKCNEEREAGIEVPQPCAREGSGEHAHAAQKIVQPHHTAPRSLRREVDDHRFPRRLADFPQSAHHECEGRAHG